MTYTNEELDRIFSFSEKGLTDEAFDQIFSHLIDFYGEEFLDSISGLDIKLYKDTWCYYLREFKNNSKPIAWALNNLPIDCPNVMVFRNHCRLAPVFQS